MFIKEGIVVLCHSHVRNGTEQPFLSRNSISCCSFITMTSIFTSVSLGQLLAFLFRKRMFNAQLMQLFWRDNKISEIVKETFQKATYENTTLLLKYSFLDISSGYCKSAHTHIHTKEKEIPCMYAFLKSCLITLVSLMNVTTEKYVTSVLDYDQVTGNPVTWL